jgi:hypothetical protein
MDETKKTPEMERALDGMAVALFGRHRTGDKCVSCGSTKVAPEDFKDAISRKEFGISRMCQPCQDSVFGEAEEIEDGRL